MNRVWNFSAGPAGLPEPVLRQAQQEMLDWRGSGASVMELSHRGKAFMALAEEVERDVRQLAAIPDHYRVLFLQGGATQHFAQIAMNLALPEQSADYLVNGHWGEKAAAEAAPYVAVRVAGRAEGNPCRAVPATIDVDPAAAYLHYTPNETIHGIEFDHVPEAGVVPLVADMSSDIFSRPLDVTRFGLIYAGAQKNIGPSGLVLMIVRDDLLARSKRPMAKIFDYAAHAAQHSMLNTPNTWGWYLSGLTFKWLLGEGGLTAIGARNQAKAVSLYQAIDGSGGFYRNEVEARSRSRMNVPFVLHDTALDAEFLKQAEAAGMIGLKGHRVLGGMRASLYNAVPLAAVEVLVDFMRDFARRHG
ncbi:MAG TPA: 3-phosphoserine/phosphohydroxythreonine transaminase [Rhodanobacteraceae bacterium]|nr:3-phosphoserine/phosphohydroxythreonine transaminase [Rhodanobacteraceae bacterium]